MVGWPWRKQESMAVTPMASRNSRRPTGAPLSFEELLANKYRMEPWVPQTFLEFLHSERNEENFFFFEEIEAFKAVKGKSPTAPSQDLLLLPSDARENPQKYAQEIVDTFIKENAPKQVNISDDQRRRLINQFVNALETQGYEPEMFAEAQNEVKKLMQHDSWPRFQRKVLDENVTIEDGRRRRKFAAITVAVYLLALGLMLGLYAPRWVIFILIIPAIWFYVSLVAYQMNFCVINAMNGKRDKFGTAHELAPVACPFTKKHQRGRMRRLMVLVLVASLVTVGFSFALTYIIEAGVGRTLYG